MDCEMVGVGPAGEGSIAARVSIVNQFGKCVYDKYVKPTQRVTDYRTAVSGIRPENLKQGGSCTARGLRRGKQEGPIPPFPCPGAWTAAAPRRLSRPSRLRLGASEPHDPKTWTLAPNGFVSLGSRD